jgi:gluconolactonase
MHSSEPEIPLEAFTIFADGLDHTECCAFDGEGVLWAGGEAGQIYRIDGSGRVEEIARMGGFCGGLAFSPDDELFVCNPAHGLVCVERSGRWTVFADNVAGKKLIEPNYPLFAHGGYLYVSDSGGWKANAGRIFRFDTQARGVEVAGGFSYANGLALSPDETALLLAESDTDSIYQIPLGTDGLATGPHEIYAAPVRHVPDGLALDSAGNLFVTCYGSHQIYRITPLRELITVAHDPTGIILGGPTNLTFRGGNMYVANLGRTTIVRARVPEPRTPR